MNEQYTCLKKQYSKCFKFIQRSFTQIFLHAGKQRRSNLVLKSRTDRQTDHQSAKLGYHWPHDKGKFSPTQYFFPSLKVTHGGCGSLFASNTDEIDDHEDGSHAQTNTGNTHQHESNRMRSSVKEEKNCYFLPALPNFLTCFVRPSYYKITVLVIS